MFVGEDVLLPVQIQLRESRVDVLQHRHRVEREAVAQADLITLGSQLGERFDVSSEGSEVGVNKRDRRDAGGRGSTDYQR